MTLELRKLLSLSTGHVTDPATREMLNDNTSENYPTLGGSTHYGWFVYANEENHYNIPADLWACMVFARLHGADYILFDCDAGPVEGLPWVEF